MRVEIEQRVVFEIKIEQCVAFDTFLLGEPYACIGGARLEHDVLHLKVCFVFNFASSKIAGPFHAVQGSIFWPFSLYGFWGLASHEGFVFCPFWGTGN